MRKLTVSTIAIFVAFPALAGGLSEPAPTPAVAAPLAPPAPSYDWTGLYAGLQFGTVANGDSTLGGVLGSVDGNAYGGFVGYRNDFGRFIAGAELDYMVGDGTIDGGVAGSFDFDLDHLVRLGLEGGLDLGRAYLYGTVGYADIEISGPGVSDSSNGYFYGVGLDFLVSEKVSVGAELLQHNFSDFTAAGDLDLLTAGINVAYRF